MNDSRDPFEAELQSMRPREPSGEMRRRIASRLEARTVPPRRLSPHVLRAAAAIAAAAVIGAAILRHGVEESTPPPSVVHAAPALVFDPLDDSLPSLWTYRKAMRRSPAAVDSLLSRHAGQSWPTASSNAVALSSVRNESQLNRLFGEP